MKQIEPRTAAVARFRLGVGIPPQHWVDRLIREQAIGAQQLSNQARRAEFYARWLRQKEPLIQLWQIK